MHITLFIVSFFVSLSAFSGDDLSFKTRIFIDGDYLGPFYQKGSDDHTGFRNHLELASIKSSIKYDITPSLKAKLQVEYKKESEDDYKDEFQVDDLYLKYDLNETSSLKLGQFKEPMGHERLMGSSSLPTIERSMVTSAFAPGRNPGLAYEFGNQSTTVHIGHFKIADDDINNGSATTGRITFATSFKQHFIHIGASASLRKFDPSIIQIKERAEVNTGDNIIRSARYSANQQDTFQGEIGAVLNDIWIMAEVYQTDIKQALSNTWQYQGFYLQASGLFNTSHNITQSSYQYKNGEFDKRKAKAKDIEWVVRYSGLNLRDNQLGAEASSLLLGVNYYFKKKVSVMADILMPNISGNVVNTNQDGYALSMRLRYEF